MAKTRRTTKASRFRTEHDLLGERSIPQSAYFGVQTARGIQNFQISGVPISHYPHLVQALAIVKLAAARANHESRALDAKRLRAIEAACEDVMAGRFHDHFPVDMFQGGAGTSTNMNANEVIANIALEHMGKRRGEYDALDPHDHVNLSQSTNDAYPTALHVAALLGNDQLLEEIGALAKSFRRKGRAFRKVVKMGPSAQSSSGEQ